MQGNPEATMLCTCCGERVEHLFAHINCWTVSTDQVHVFHNVCHALQKVRKVSECSNECSSEEPTISDGRTVREAMMISSGEFAVNAIHTNAHHNSISAHRS